jgi:hypothetical protein
MLRHVHHSSASSRTFSQEAARTTRINVASSSSSSSNASTPGSSRSHSPVSSLDFGLPPSLFLLPGNNGGTIGGGGSSAHKFNPNLSREEQLDLRQLESHLTITLQALDRARRTFLLQFSCLMALAIGFLTHWVYHAWISTDAATASSGEGSSSESLLPFGCCMIGILVYIASGTLTDRLYGADQYIQSTNRWLDLFGVRWQPHSPAGERFLLETLPPPLPPAPPATASSRSSSKDMTKRGGSWAQSLTKMGDGAATSSSFSAAADPFDQPPPASLQFSVQPLSSRFSTASSSSSSSSARSPITEEEESAGGVDSVQAAASAPEATAMILAQQDVDNPTRGEGCSSPTDSAPSAEAGAAAPSPEMLTTSSVSFPPPASVSPASESDIAGKDTPMTVQAELERLPEAEFVVQAISARNNSQ